MSDANDIPNLGSLESNYAQLTELDNEISTSLEKMTKAEFEKFTNFVNNEIYIQNSQPSIAPFKPDFIYPLNK